MFEIVLADHVIWMPLADCYHYLSPNTSPAQNSKDTPSKIHHNNECSLKITAETKLPGYPRKLPPEDYFSG